MIFVDYNQVALSNIFVFTKELKDANEKEMLDICRHGIINTLISYKRKFGQEYGELVITADYGNYWRKDIFAEYKAGRKKYQEESEFNWELAWKCLNQVRDEIKDHFPWKLIRVKRCEADDIVAVLCKYFQENEFASSGIFDEPQPILIISSDGDNSQLTKYDNVRQWCPNKKSYLPKMSKKDLKAYMIDHVVKGDTSDGIPNIFMPSSFFLDRQDGERQKSVTQKILSLFIEHGDDAINHLPMDKKETEKEFQDRIKQVKIRYEQNSRIILYDNIPQYIHDDIVNYYHDSNPVGTKDTVRKYFIKNRMNLLMESLQDI